MADCDTPGCEHRSAVDCMISMQDAKIAALKLREAELEVEVDLLRYHLTAVCDAAEKGGTCGACGEVFNAPMPSGGWPECPIPGARDFLKDPKGTVESVLTAVEKKAKDLDGKT